MVSEPSAYLFPHDHFSLGSLALFREILAVAVDAVLLHVQVCFDLARREVEYPLAFLFAVNEFRLILQSPIFIEAFESPGPAAVFELPLALDAPAFIERGAWPIYLAIEVGCLQLFIPIRVILCELAVQCALVVVGHHLEVAVDVIVPDLAMFDPVDKGVLRPYCRTPVPVVCLGTVLTVVDTSLASQGDVVPLKVAVVVLLVSFLLR